MIGPIKSVKSTFVNAFLESDYLKRGAGVITSIVTRIRQGDTPTATLYFKSWDDINREIQHAIVIFPDSAWRQREEPFEYGARTTVGAAAGFRGAFHRSVDYPERP